MHAVTVENVTVASRRRIRLDGVSLALQGGQTYGLVGPNGAGKSTLLSVLGGLVVPRVGSVRHQLGCRKDIGRVAAALDPADLNPARTVSEAMRLATILCGAEHRSGEELLRQSGLGSVTGHTVRRLSLGMRARLGIAIALVGSPQLVLLDEPMNGLDPDGMVWVRGLAKRLASEGRIVVVSSHLLTEVEAMADEVIVMSQGRVVSVARMQQVESGSAIRVDRPDRLLAELARRGHRADDDAGVVSSDLAPGEMARIAVGIGLEVSDLGARRRLGLQQLFDDATVAEFAAGGE